MIERVSTNQPTQPAVRSQSTSQTTEPQVKDVQNVESTKKDVEKAVKTFNEFLKETSTNVQFQFHEDLNEYYVTVVNTMTNEVIKEIPSKKLLDFHAAMRDFLGLLVDKKV
ncbi:flagellar protein FlaG [Mangrovibacillus cuniculi]|uniref:Flagellar protein FlaG n=1 Tax=Mangrovibacillus cuniculi TaxID=2593652 RepID=A0A7S8CCK2_9BACI|nr:flagellar protein FlaG [Mangrovibacillus cuniculi]QPC47504.1 flagellar protein FlaG [Mangrovibacillus cuniculi]